MFHSKMCQAEMSHFLYSTLMGTVIFHAMGQVFKRAWLSFKTLNEVAKFPRCFRTHQLPFQIPAAHVRKWRELYLPICACPLGLLLSVHKYCLLVSPLQLLPWWVSNMLHAVMIDRVTIAMSCQARRGHNCTWHYLNSYTNEDFF